MMDHGSPRRMNSFPGSSVASSLSTSSYFDNNLNSGCSAFTASGSDANVMDFLALDVNKLREALNDLSKELQKASVVQQEGHERKSDENNNDNQGKRLNSSPFVDIHERLSTVIKTFEIMCARYVFFSCDEVLDPVSSLVKSVKNLQSTNEGRDPMELIDQAKVLVETFQSAIAKCAGEYMTWELMQYEKSSVAGDLTSDDVSTSYQLSTMPLTASSAASAPPNLIEYGSSDEVEKILLNVENGVELALDYAKSWSRYCKEILYFVQQRINLELEHAKKIQKLTESTKSNLQGMPFLPLKNVYDASFLAENEMLNHCTNILDKLHEYKFVKPLEARRLDHDQKRKELQNIWDKQMRQLGDIKIELRKAKQNRCQKQLNYRKARESSLRLESSLTTASAFTVTAASGAIMPKSPTLKKASTAATTPLTFLAAETLQQPTLAVSALSCSNGNGSPQMNELISSADRSKIDKKRRAEEDAMVKSKNAQEECSNLEIIYADKCKEVEFTKIKILNQLHELIYQCDQTTKACTSSYFQALSSLWDTWPGKYTRFNEKTRDYIPGYEYLNFARTFNRKSNSSDPLQPQHLRLLTANNVKHKSSRNCPSTAPVLMKNQHHPTTGSSSSSSSHLPPTLPQRSISTAAAPVASYFKESSDEVSSLSSSISRSKIDLSTAAKSHKLHKVPKVPTRCSHCDSYTFFQTIQCVECFMCWHKDCLKYTNLPCETTLNVTAGPLTINNSLTRRMSIFGVDLTTHLKNSNTDIPGVITKCIEELEKRGLTSSGLYRVCGVKTKTEELCQQFENNTVADLSDIPSSNIASVIKLYLRQLPEPLFTHQLFADFMKIGEKLSDDHLSSFSDYYPDISLKLIIKKLPQINYNLAKVLLLHLNRVTWFEKENQMSSTNLGIVFGPTLLWKKDGLNLVDLPMQNKVVETAIVYAYEIFDVSDLDDLKRFNLTKNPTAKDKHRSSRSLRLSHPLALNFEGTCSPEEKASLASTVAEKLRRNKTVTPDLLKHERYRKYLEGRQCQSADADLNICDLKIRKESEDSHQSTASSKESVAAGTGVVDFSDQKPLLKAPLRRKQAGVASLTAVNNNNGSKAAAAYSNEVTPEMESGVDESVDPTAENKKPSVLVKAGSQDSGEISYID